MVQTKGLVFRLCRTLGENWASQSLSLISHSLVPLSSRTKSLGLGVSSPCLQGLLLSQADQAHPKEKSWYWFLPWHGELGTLAMLPPCPIQILSSLWELNIQRSSYGIMSSAASPPLL